MVLCVCRVGQIHTFIGITIYGVHAVFLAGNSPYIRSYTMQIYGSGQPYVYVSASCSCLFHILCCRMLVSNQYTLCLFSQDAHVYELKVCGGICL